MRRMFRLFTILITSFVLALSGLAASSVASASDSHTVRVSATFPLGSSTLTKAQKASIKKAVATSGTDATFTVTAAAGKLTGVSDSAVELLAENRGKAVKAYLVKLGVSKSSVAVKMKITRLGIVPKTKIVGIYVVPTMTTATTTSTATTPTNTTTPSAPWTPAYAVGATGPGGGQIYYVDVTGFNCGATYTPTGSPTSDLCHYLEVAPSVWNTGSDPLKVWAVTAKQGSDVTGLTNDSNVNNSRTGIGLGLQNSIAIVAQGNDTTTAAGLARAYTGGSKSDWYLPTTAELTLLCQWSRNVTQDVATVCTGGTFNAGAGTSGVFVGGNYWSSSEGDASSAWVQYFQIQPQSANGKGNSQYVRPVRAF